MFTKAVLFNVYMEDLLGELRSSGVGVRMVNLFMECLAHADDFALISPTALDLQRLLNICMSYT